MVIAVHFIRASTTSSDRAICHRIAIDFFGVQTTNDDWMGIFIHGKNGARIDTMLDGQTTVAIEHSAYIYGMGQSVLEKP